MTFLCENLFSNNRICEMRMIRNLNTMNNNLEVEKIEVNFRTACTSVSMNILSFLFDKFIHIHIHIDIE